MPQTPQSSDLKQFIALSLVLTAEQQLSGPRAQSYFDRLKLAYPQQMTQLLSQFAVIAADRHLVFEVKRRIVDSVQHAPLVRQIIRCWLTSEFLEPDPAGTPSPAKPNTGSEDDFYSGLIWSVIEAHPPARSHRPYGYWAKRPPRARQS